MKSRKNEEAKHGILKSHGLTVTYIVRNLKTGSFQTMYLTLQQKEQTMKVRCYLDCSFFLLIQG
jgi:hypothetical protein